MKSSWQGIKGMLLLPHVPCKTLGNCIHVSYTNTHKWDSLFQCKDTRKDILKNCYPHPLWDFTVLSVVWNSETKKIGKTPGRRRQEGNLFAEDERNRRGAREQVSLCRQAQEKSPGVALCLRRTGPLQEKEGRRSSNRSTVCARALCGSWGRKYETLMVCKRHLNFLVLLECLNVLWALHYFFFFTSYICLY